MFGQRMAFTVLITFCLLTHLLAHTLPDRELPDLKIQQYEFVSTNDKWVRVQVANAGKSASKPCRLELAVRKIRGVGSTRSATEIVPSIEPGREVWVTINTSGILDSATGLKNHTTFRLRVDETNIVEESNEDNNELWHGE